MNASSLTRRALLTGRRQNQVSPPGFLGEKPELCRDCAICAEHCPTSIIVTSEYGPRVDFARGECTFCGECRTHCPSGDALFAPVARFPHIIDIGEACLPRGGVDCQACRDACPTSAIRFRPRLGGPFLPELDASACTGCGACVVVCPVNAVSIAPMKEMTDA